MGVDWMGVSGFGGLITGSRRRYVYPAVIGVAVGSLLTGLVLPMTVDAENDQPVAAQQDAVPGRDLNPGSGTETDGDVMGDGIAPDGGERGGTTGDGNGGVARDASGPATASTDAPTPPPGEGPSPDGGAVRTASEVGVTATEIHVGALLFDTASAGDLGFGLGASVEHQRRWYESFIAEVNDAGGIHGRKVVPSFVTYDVTDPEDSRRACVEMAEDVKPFLVFGYAFTLDAGLCVTERFRIPMMGWLSVRDEWYRRAEGRWITTGMSTTAMSRTLARRSHEQGHLRNRTVGVLMLEGGETALNAELEALGYKIAHTAKLSENLETAQTQIAVAISEMRRKGVDRILSTSGALHMALWWNQAEGQGYRPLYLVSDVLSTGGDFGAQAAPQSVQAIAYTSYRDNEHRAGLPEQPESAACRARHAQRTGEEIERGAPARYVGFVQHCGLFEVFVKAATAAGPGLTRAGLVAGTNTLGTFPSPNFGGALSFGPGKPDGADFVRTKEYRRDCRCFVPVDDFTRAR